MTDTLASLRIASRFSLWMWAIYWPGSGLVLLAGGMTDPASLFVVAGSLLGFALLAASGGIEASASRNMREFLLERPLYVIGGAVLLAVASTFIDPLQNIGLALFSGLFLLSVLLVGHRLLAHARARQMGLVASRADQVLIAAGLGAVSAAVIFLDALLPLFGIAPTPAVAASVVTVNLVSLLYPPLLLLSLRPFREPLRNPFRRRTHAPAATGIPPVEAPSLP